MGRIIFFIGLAFLVFLAIRIWTRTRRDTVNKLDPNFKSTDQSQTDSVVALKPCPLCAQLMPDTELSAHLKDVHRAQ